MAYDLRGFARDLGSIDRVVAIAVGAATRKAAFDIQRGAQQAAPVDTGALRSSIGVDYSTGLDTISTRSGGSQTVEIGPSVHYGAYVELGTSRHGPQPYLAPAYDRVIPGYEAAIDAILGSVGL